MRYHKSCTTLNGHFGLMIDYDSIFQLVDCGGKKDRPVHPEKGLGQIRPQPSVHHTEDSDEPPFGK